MKNIDRQKNQIATFAVLNMGIAVDRNSRIVFPCEVMKCEECLFEKAVSCKAACIRWLQEEAEEPKIDWSKIPIDTPIYVRNNESQEWMIAHFAKYEHWRIYAWDKGTTSHTAQNNEFCSSWNYAKLAYESI